jgi:hypothetical protein
MKREGSGSGSASGSESESISQRHGPTDPDPNPHQNVMAFSLCRKMKKILMSEMAETESTLGQDLEDDVSSIQVTLQS